MSIHTINTTCIVPFLEDMKAQALLCWDPHKLKLINDSIVLYVILYALMKCYIILLIDLVLMSVTLIECTSSFQGFPRTMLVH